MSNNRPLQRLKSHFGNFVDDDVLLSVLAICDNDANQAIAFLTAGQDDFVEDPNAINEESIPQDYPGMVVPVVRPVPVPAPVLQGEDEMDSEFVEVVGFIKRLVVNESSLQEHDDAYKSHPSEYVTVILLLSSQGVDFSRSSKARMLAICWNNRELHPLADYLLGEFKEFFGLPEVLRACQLLDAPRKIRSYERRIDVLTAQGAKQRKITNVRAKINDIDQEIIESSLPRSLTKRVRRWIKDTFDPPQLEFFALQMPREPWQQLADLIHVCPTDFQCDWFLNFIFSGEHPEESLASVAEKLSPFNLVTALNQGHHIPYSYLRTNVKPINDDAKALIAEYTPLETLIWYHEELHTAQVDKIIEQRILSEEKLDLPYGKIMERLLYFKRSGAKFYELLTPIAEEKLARIELLLEPPVAVLGDASFSMDVAIRTATIISSVLTMLASAELKFFNTETVEPPCYPLTIDQVIDVASNVAADGLTAPACVLHPYLTQRKPVKFFICVTDEIENLKYNDQYYFPDLFLRYYQEVYPAKLVFVSFLDDPNGKGRMVRALENMGFDILQFRLDGARPDLTKLDTLLGILSSESSFFPKYVQEFSELYNSDGFDALVHRIQNPPDRKKMEIPDPSTLIPDRIVVRPDVDVPQHLCCPITYEIMNEPVMAPSGYTYEKSAILDHLSRSSTDPFTNEPLSANDLRPNRAIRDAIESYLEQQN